MAALGFDFDHGRLDESLHPFCGGVPDDVRMTARYDEARRRLRPDGGPARDRPRALQRRPAQGLARPAGRRAALDRAAREPVAAGRDAGLPLARRSSAISRRCWPRPSASAARPSRPTTSTARRSGSQRSLIRVDADEVTYPLHIILRYRLEQALLAGDLEVADLPGAWNEGMRELLGVVPPDDREGVLQDIHWPAGAFGYFPCYTLGAIMAAQLFEALSRPSPDLPAQIADGDFRPLLAWLRANVHEQGSLLDTQELLARATGRPLEPQPFLATWRRATSPELDR